MDSVLPEKPVDVTNVVEVEPTTREERLLKEIRSDFAHFKDYWRENREEMETDMRYAGGDAFTDQERRVTRAGRPCETPDELSQYVKQTNNNLRQNKRDAKISPASEDATGDDAEKRESVLRGINHRGNFQAAFQTAYEQCTWCGFGVWGISIRHSDPSKQHLEPRPRRIANQFSVLLDPYAKEADYSDQRKCFVFDVMRRSDFAREYPDAQRRSFSADDMKLVGEDWLSGENITIAEAWRIEDNDKVVQYITNGLEILDEIPWVGSWIPIIPILGEEIYVSESGKIKRKYLSLIRRARTPQKMLAFIASQELEEFGMAPRVPFIGYKGQFASKDWLDINVSPKPFIEVPLIADPLNPDKVLPLPTRPQYTPNAAAYEMAREAWRRGVQAAIGITPLPTAAQRQNEKSGVALEKIETQEAIGSYHFVDNADRALANYGRQMNELISKVMTKPRHVGVRKQDDTHGLLHLSTAEHGMPDGVDSEENVLFVDRGIFDVTVTTGPSRESQRAEASDFVDTLLANLKSLPIPAPIAQKILSLAIKLKNVGPLGEEIAKMLDPEEGDPMQQAQKIMAQAHQQQELVGLLQKELGELRLKAEGKEIENRYKLQIEEMRTGLEKYRIDVEAMTKKAVAEITTKAQAQSERLAALKEVAVEMHGSDQEVSMQAADHAHETALSAQEHQQELEQGKQQAQNVVDQSGQAAANEQALVAAQADSGGDSTVPADAAAAPAQE